MSLARLPCRRISFWWLFFLCEVSVTRAFMLYTSTISAISWNSFEKLWKCWNLRKIRSIVTGPPNIVNSVNQFSIFHWCTYNPMCYSHLWFQIWRWNLLLAFEISLDKGVSNCSLLGLQSLSLFLLSGLTPPSQALPARHGTWWLAGSSLRAFVSSVELSAPSSEDTWDHSSY